MTTVLLLHRSFL